MGGCVVVTWDEPPSFST